MRKSSKILVGGIFLIAVVIGAEAFFCSIGLEYGPSQLIGSALAGLAGAFKLVS